MARHCRTDASRWPTRVNPRIAIVSARVYSVDVVIPSDTPLETSRGTLQPCPLSCLTDVSSEEWQESFSIDATAMGLAEAYPWSVKKHRLRGGRRDGVDLIIVDNGALRFSIVPTRGMGLWKGWYDGNRLGWDSPVTDGPVHPSLVNLAAAGGLGWLDGFDELLARCGLENNGAPFEVKTVKPDGSESNTTFGLHGKIANIPASYVAVHVGDGTAARDRRRRARRGVSPVRPSGPHGHQDRDGPRLKHVGRS